MKMLSVQNRFFLLLFALLAAQYACTSYSFETSNESPLGSTPASSPSANLSERGTPAEAHAMLELAIAHYLDVGREQALADFNSGQAPFFDRDLYVVCIDANHIETANGGFPQYVGVSADSLLDVNGNPLGRTIWDISSPTAINSVGYQWINPVSGETEPKILFFEKIDSEVCGVGAYNP